MQKAKEKQKKFLGTVPKKCQLVETFWDCPEISKTNNNGITLIALIITVIVMLILVGVTINVALNGGLFTKARQAANDYQYQEDYEMLQVAVVGALDENLQIPNAETLQNNLPSGWTVTGEDAGPFTATSPSGNVFTVDKDGTITGQNGGSETPGGDDTGETGWVDNGDGTFTKGDTTVEIGKTTYTNAEVQEKLGATGGTYKGTWTVIGVEGDKLKLVSTTNVNNSNVALGKTDQNVYKKDAEGNITTELKDEIEDLNGDEDLEFEKAVWSYANAVNTLNEEAKKATGITSAESITIEDIYDIIGEENVDKNSSGSYGDVYNYYFDTDKSKVCSKKSTGTDENGEEQWGSANTTLYATQTFVDSEGRTVTIDANNPDASVRLSYDYFSYTLTDAQKSAIGSLATGYYWLASPCVYCTPNYADFRVRFMSSGNISSDSSLFCSYGYAGNGSMRSPCSSFNLRSEQGDGLFEQGDGLFVHNKKKELSKSSFFWSG